MVGTLLARGMLVGLLAGLLGSCFAYGFGEPQVALAIAFESRVHQLAGAPPDPELVGRATQSTLGLLTGVTVYGTALGGLFALAYAFAQGRIPGRSGALGPRGTAVLVAAAGFTTLILVPQLKYPANPPAIGEPDTIGLRTAAYFGMILLSVGAAAVALSLGHALSRRLDRWNAALAGLAAYVVLATVAMLLLPAVNEVPPGFSAETLWRFRLASLGINATIWTTLALAFGALTHRAVAGIRPVR